MRKMNGTWDGTGRERMVRVVLGRFRGRKFRVRPKWTEKGLMTQH